MKTVIDRKELKEIHDIACKTWKPIIEKYAQRNPFGSTIEFTTEEINKMLTASTNEQFTIVCRVFEVYETSEIVKTVEDACKFLGEDDEEVKALRVLIDNALVFPRHIIAGQELVVIIRALNDKHDFDWKNSKGLKYYICWYFGDNFRLYYVSYSGSSSDVGSRLCFKSRELAEYAAKQFKDIYRDYLTVQ